MPILSEVGKRQPGQMAIRISVYALLTLGALGIIYPVLIVIGQTLSDEFDLRDNAVAPFYLFNRNELLLKRVFSYTTKLELLASRHNRSSWTSQMRMREDSSFYAELPARIKGDGFSMEHWQEVVEDFRAFKASQPPDRMLAKLFCLEDYYRPYLRETFAAKANAFREQLDAGGELPEWFVMMFPDPSKRRRIVRRRDQLGLAIMNHELRSDYLNYHGLEVMRPGNILVPFWRPGNSAKERLWIDFKRSLPPEQLLLVSSDAYWHAFLKLKYRNIQGLNAAWGTDLAGIYELAFPAIAPADEAIALDWQEFVLRRWPRSLLRVPQRYATAWREHVRQQLVRKAGAEAGGEAEALAKASRLCRTSIGSWAELPFFAQRPEDETLSRYWCEFTASGKVQAEDLELISPERGFQEFLVERYGAAGQSSPVAALNAAWGTSFSSVEGVRLPFGVVDLAPVRHQALRCRWRFMNESYRRVFEYLTGRGRAIQNTLILVALSLLSALTINPIAAYSLSRFPMKHSQKVLVFFLATMAFPAEVAMIPNFLLLRDLGLLNTYAALVLPRMANGFAIFLLKGFYDSLPQELYQAAEIDGASEIQIFRMVAMPLVLPILAYIGLNTFVMAYSSFMWAFVICPKQEMWTLMVWVYDFQMKNPGNNYIMAATVLVSIPPLFVFLFANRIIMRGIVIPSLK